MSPLGVPPDREASAAPDAGHLAGSPHRVEHGPTLALPDQVGMNLRRPEPRVVRRRDRIAVR